MLREFTPAKKPARTVCKMYAPRIKSLLHFIMIYYAQAQRSPSALLREADCAQLPLKPFAVQSLVVVLLRSADAANWRTSECRQNPTIAEGFTACRIDNATQQCEPEFMSDNVSSNVLFHITGSMKNLKGILRKGFVPNCCAEYSLSAADEDAWRRNKAPVCSPAMVCFCDLTMPMLGKHLAQYGDFGIGVKKEWGIKNGVEPVIYTHPNGCTRRPVERLTEMTAKTNQKTMSDDLKFLAAYTKRHRGNPWRNGAFQKEVHFYDEREWRFVPTKPNGGPFCLEQADYANHTKRNSIKRKLAQYALRVEPDDIMYLFVPDDNHIMDLHKFLLKLYGDYDGILVTTAIMTKDAITNDS